MAYNPGRGHSRSLQPDPSPIRPLAAPIACPNGRRRHDQTYATKARYERVAHARELGLGPAA
eukprot:15480055-Alexandrium_andersonii.AAC.1